MEVSTSRPLKPLLKWAGGKSWLVPRLRELYEPHRHRRLVEPFVGAGAVAYGLRPEKAYLTDSCWQLINFHNWVRRVGRRSIVDMRYDRNLYLMLRTRFNAMFDDAYSHDENAELFYYLNHTCFNGLYRVNRRGEFNVPFGKYKTVTYHEDFSEHREAMKNWEISTIDFRFVRPATEDFVYLDPPYDAGFVGYVKDGFLWDAQVELAKKFATHPGPVVASNSATERIVDLYRGLGYQVQCVVAPRRISRDGNRAPVEEMLATKNL